MGGPPALLPPIRVPGRPGNGSHKDLPQRGARNSCEIFVDFQQACSFQKLGKFLAFFLWHFESQKKILILFWYKVEGLTCNFLLQSMIRSSTELLCRTPSPQLGYSSGTHRFLFPRKTWLEDWSFWAKSAFEAPTLDTLWLSSKRSCFQKHDCFFCNLCCEVWKNSYTFTTWWFIVF